ncbi:MAG: hypothetical protein ACI4RE_02220, partial [Christensenellales bacterium]
PLRNPLSRSVFCFFSSRKKRPLFFFLERKEAKESQLPITLDTLLKAFCTRVQHTNRAVPIRAARFSCRKREAQGNG